MVRVREADRIRRDLAEGRIAGLARGNAIVRLAELDRMARRPVDVESPAARALRAVQKMEAVEFPTNTAARDCLFDVKTYLGEALGLQCTSDDADDHNGATCPIHEWLVPADFDEVDDA